MLRHLMILMAVCIGFTSCNKTRINEDKDSSNNLGYKYEPPSTSPIPKNTTPEEFLPKYIRSYIISDVGNTPDSLGKRVAATLVYYTDETIGRCTAFHFKDDIVLTNAHCLKSSIDPKRYYLIYWNKDGKQSSTQVTSIGEMGWEGGVDAAILKIPPGISMQWDSLNGEFQDTTTLIGSKLGQNTMDVSIWAMNQLDGTGDIYHPDWSRLVEKKCKATPRTIPLFEGLNKVVSLNWKDLRDSNDDETYHIFYDNCDEGTINGNSGSLVTDSKTGKAVGIHFGSSHEKDLARHFNKIRYTGSLGQPIEKDLDANKSGEDFITGIGASMDYVATYLHLFP